jgi:SpoVK/Ycf46/Vps4 family AAA+-type ATPase
MANRSQLMNADITALLKARNTLLWITSREEVRVERAVISAAGAAKYETFFWDCVSGITDSTRKTIDSKLSDPIAALGYIRDKGKRGVYVLRDLNRFQDPYVLRSIRNLARDFQGAKSEDAKSLLILTPNNTVPEDWTGNVTVLDYPLPDREEIAKILDNTLEVNGQKPLTNGARDAAIDAALGLSAEEAANCYSKSLVTVKRIDPAIVSNEKKRVVAREKVVTWYDPDPRGLDGVGGYDLMKDWLRARQSAFSERARAFGLPAPKGIMLAGIPGCGKSLTAKCIAATWQMPLLRLDLGALRSKYVGESEGNIRKALAVAEAIGKCVLWLDEIEKALAGSTGPQGDGGVAADALGAVLNWMQERQGSVFVVATANDVRGLPPELLRKGRFDELFWVDLPTKTERTAILKATLKQFNREVENCERLASATSGFTGAEIAAIVPDALFVAFADGERDLTLADLEAAAKSVVPLSRTAESKLNDLREWAKTCARAASLPEEDSVILDVSSLGARVVEDTN